MLSIQGVTALLNDSSYQTPAVIHKWRDVYYGISLHTTGACPSFRQLRGDGRAGEVVYPTGYYGPRYDYLFDTYLLNRHPRESEAIRQWRKSQYKPYTQAPFQQVIDITRGAIFQDSNYSISIDDKDDNDYIQGNNFNGKSLPQFISDSFQSICEDPNGFFVVLPAQPHYATTTSRISPKVYFIPSRNIVGIGDDEMIFELGGTVWCVNTIGYFRFEENEDGEYEHVDEAYGGYYAHMLGRLPALVAGGIWNTHGFYESWLKAAQAFADEFVSSKSAEQLVNKEVSHPFITAASEECPDCNGTGKISWLNPVTEEHELVKCANEKCYHGKISHNPADWMIVPAEDMGKQLIQITNPDVNINKFHADNNCELFNGMMRALHLNYIEQAQSAVAKDKDMEGRYQFTLNISNDLFGRLIRGIIIEILSLRSVSMAEGMPVAAPTDFVIVKPTQFQIKTASDLLADYKRATDASVPDYMKARQLEDYVDKQYGGDEVLKRKTNLINRMDPLAASSEGDKQAKVLGGAISKRSWQFNTYLPSLLDEVIRNKGKEWFVYAAYEAIKMMVDETFALIPEVEAVMGAERSTVYER